MGGGTIVIPYIHINVHEKARHWGKGEVKKEPEDMIVRFGIPIVYFQMLEHTRVYYSTIQYFIVGSSTTQYILVYYVPIYYIRLYYVGKPPKP